MKRENNTISTHVFYLAEVFHYSFDSNVSSILEKDEIFQILLHNCVNSDPKIQYQCIMLLNNLITYNTTLVSKFNKFNLFSILIENFDSLTTQVKDAFIMFIFNLTYEVIGFTIEYLSPNFIQKVLGNIEILSIDTLEIVFKCFNDIFSRESCDEFEIIKTAFIEAGGIDILEEYSEYNNDAAEYANSLLTLLNE